MQTYADERNPACEGMYTLAGQPSKMVALAFRAPRTQKPLSSHGDERGFPSRYHSDSAKRIMRYAALWRDNGRYRLSLLIFQPSNSRATFGELRCEGLAADDPSSLSAWACLLLPIPIFSNIVPRSEFNVNHGFCSSAVDHFLGLLPEILNHARQDAIQPYHGFPADQLIDFTDSGHATMHILKAGFVGLIVRDIDDLG